VNGPVILSEYQFAKGSAGHRADMALLADAPLLLAEVKRLRDELDNERVARPYSVSNERLWEQIDKCNRIASESVTRALDIKVFEILPKDRGHKKYPFEKDSETGRFDMENFEWVNPPERLWLDAVVAEVKRLRKQLVAHTDFVLWVEEEHNEVFDEYERKDEL